MKSSKNNLAILILEDDADQMRLLASLAKSEVKKVMLDESINNKQRQTLKDILIIKASNTDDLQKTYRRLFRAIKMYY